MTPEEQLNAGRHVEADSHPLAQRLNPSIPKDCSFFRTYRKPITSEVKHRVKYSELCVLDLDTRSLGSPFGKSLGKALARHVNGVETHPVAHSLIQRIETQFHVSFLQAEYSLGCWARNKSSKNTYLVVGSIDFVLWNSVTQQFMVLELKTKKEKYVNYWYKGRSPSTLWANDLPQAIVYARSLRCQLQLDYEPKIMILLCSRHHAYPRIISSYGEQDYSDTFQWSLREPKTGEAIHLPASALKKGVQGNTSTKIRDLFRDDLTLGELAAVFQKKLVILPSALKE